MADFVTLTCPSCGGKLQLTDDIERFACAYCGTEHVVRRSGGIVSLAPVIESLSKVQVATDKTASELAIKMLKSEIGELEGEYRQLQNQIGQVNSGGCSPMSIGLAIGVLCFVASAQLIDTVGLALLVGILTSALPITLGVVFSKNAGAHKEKLKKRQETLANEINRKRSELKKHQEIVNL